MKIGDKVLYVNYTTKGLYNYSDRVKVGYIFHADIDKIGLATYRENSTYNDSMYVVFEKMLNTEAVVLLNQTNLEATIEHVENVMKEQVAKIKKLTAEEKDELKRKEFNRIREQIISTARNMVIEEDGEGFVDCLKAICQLKKQLFSIKISELHNVHKSNGEIKYKIKQLQKVIEELKNIEVDK